jgi:hypothetical protein
MFMRALIGSGPNAEKNGLKIAPVFKVLRQATYSSGIRPARGLREIFPWSWKNHKDGVGRKRHIEPKNARK